MKSISDNPSVFLALAMLTLPMSGNLYAQQQELPDQEILVNANGQLPADLSELAEGPEVKGFIAAKGDDEILVTSPDGNGTAVRISDNTEIRATKGFLGLRRSKLGADSLLNGLPVTVRTVQWGEDLVARKIKFDNEDLQTAALVRNGTAQRFGQQDRAIGKNAAATTALRGRLGDIDQYNIKSTTNVNFDTGRAALSPGGKAALCATAAQAEATDNALLLVVGYTDSTGSQEINQRLSEKRASSVVNYLQQECGWKPYRMLTPTGLAMADPVASNATAQGKAQNRRVAVNILVSKSVDGL